jgi:hypothetical protein
MTSVCRYARRHNLNISCVFVDSEFSTYYDWMVSGQFGGKETAYDQLVAPDVSGIGAGALGALNFGVTTR